MMHALEPSRATVDPRPRVYGRPPRVLVADDDPEMRRLISDTLRKEGYVTVEEPDGGRLLVRIASLYNTRGSEPVDLVISDVRMPVCSGLDILKGIRDAHWETPFLLMTAFPDNDVERRATKLGATLFHKPFQMSELRTTVRQLLAS